MSARMTSALTWTPPDVYKRQVRNKFLRIFLLQFIAYTVIGVIGAVSFHSFELTAVCLLAPIQVLANQLSFMMMVEDVKFKNAIFFTARITNTVITILAFYTMDRTILVALALIVGGDVITVVMALLRRKRMPNPMKEVYKRQADDRRDQRHLRQTRPERIKPLKKRIERGEAAARDDGIEDERAPQRAPAADVAGRVEHKPRNGGGKAEPVVQQQRHAQHAALGDVGKRMNIVQAEGENGTARERQKTFAQRKIRPK